MDKFLYLCMNAEEKHIEAPATHQHIGVGWNANEVHDLLTVQCFTHES